MLFEQFTYLWLGNFLDISSINICSTFLSYSVTKSNMEDFVSIVFVFENPSINICKQYNNTDEADQSCAMYRDSTEFVKYPDPTATTCILFTKNSRTHYFLLRETLQNSIVSG